MRLLHKTIVCLQLELMSLLQWWLHACMLLCLLLYETIATLLRKLLSWLHVRLLHKSTVTLLRKLLCCTHVRLLHKAIVCLWLELLGLLHRCLPTLMKWLMLHTATVKCLLLGHLSHRYCLT